MVRDSASLGAVLPGLTGGLPSNYPVDRLRNIRFVRMPDSQPTGGVFGPEAAASFQRVGSTGLLHWGSGLSGATILHELTHAVQFDLRAQRLHEILASVYAADSEGGLAARDVEDATLSLRLVVAGTLDGELRKQLSEQIQRVVRLESPFPEGVLQRRADAVIRLLANPEWVSATDALAPENSERFGHVALEEGLPWDWRQEIRALLAMEVMAYEAERVCQEGQTTRFWHNQGTNR